MHMSDALLSPAVGATFWAGTIAGISWCARKLRESLDEKLIPLMGVLGAFVFAAQMINFTIPATGSSGHLGGGMLLAIVLGPYAAFLSIASVLTIQAFFFADGGLLALGCNIWNLGVYPCFMAYPLIYRRLARNGGSPKRLTAASVLSVSAGLQLGAFSVVVQTVLSGRSDLPFDTFLLMMQPIHLAIGLVEGFVTAGVVNYVRATRPEILESAGADRPIGGVRMKGILFAFLVLALLTGGGLSWFASSHPDGLEWSIEKIYGRPGLPEDGSALGKALRDVQDRTAVLPDYNFRKEGAPRGQKDENSEAGPWPAVDPGTSASGVAGAVMVLALIALIGVGIRLVRKRGKGGP